MRHLFLRIAVYICQDHPPTYRSVCPSCWCTSTSVILCLSTIVRGNGVTVRFCKHWRNTQSALKIHQRQVTFHNSYHVCTFPHYPLNPPQLLMRSPGYSQTTGLPPWVCHACGDVFLSQSGPWFCSHAPPHGRECVRCRGTPSSAQSFPQS